MVGNKLYTSERSLGKAIDWKLIFCYLALIFIGWLNIYASIHGSEASTVFDWGNRGGKQLVWIATALILAVVILFVLNPRLWEVLSTPLYFMAIILLITVIFVGADIKGSRSWFNFGPISFQPAEISKITTSLFLSMVMSKVNFRMDKPRDFINVAFIIGIPMLIIIAESETGSALVYLGFIFVLYTQGLSGWILAFGGLAILLFILTLVTNPLIAILSLFALVAVYFFAAIKGTRKKSLARRTARFASLVAIVTGVILIFSTQFIFDKVLQDHQRKRIEVLLGMKEDPSGVGYNVRQSMIAIGSGGFAGKGYLNGTQTTYGFVPEQSTDFIFCTVGEEWGFIGCLGVIALYVLLISRIIKDAQDSREKFTQIYGYCVASCLFMHMFINIGMTIGLMPVIGIPLPLLSYGGSSLWSFTIMIFIFISLYRQEKKYF